MAYLTWIYIINLTDVYHFVCSAQQKLYKYEHFNKLCPRDVDAQQTLIIGMVLRNGPSVYIYI